MKKLNDLDKLELFVGDRLMSTFEFTEKYIVKEQEQYWDGYITALQVVYMEILNRKYNK
jgi:hypothetical protein